jgi:hypothetical protein
MPAMTTSSKMPMPSEDEDKFKNWEVFSDEDTFTTLEKQIAESSTFQETRLLLKSPE